jgi:hypothetical protein
MNNNAKMPRRGHGVPRLRCEWSEPPKAGSGMESADVNYRRNANVK